MGDFVKLARIEDIAEGSALSIEYGNEKIALFNLGGEIFATDDMCTHAEASLAEGEIKGDEVECPFHGARFNIKTGAPTAPPAFVALRTYRVRVVDGSVEVEI